MTNTTLEPIRRFNVFAEVFVEYQKQQQESDGMPADRTKGSGLWLAKVVVPRTFGGIARRSRLRQEIREQGETFEPMRDKHLSPGG